MMQREGTGVNRMVMHAKHVTTLTDNLENHNYVNNDTA